MSDIPIVFWIPPDNHPVYKVILKNQNSSYDVTDYILSGDVTWGVNENMGGFEIEIANYDEMFTGIFIGGETFEFYLDYNDATTKYFVGVVDKVSYIHNPFKSIKLSGRHFASKLSYINIGVVSDTDVEVSWLLKAFIDALNDAYGYDFTYNNVQPTSTSIPANFTDKPFFDVIADLCQASDYDLYVDIDGDFHFFPSKSIYNYIDAAVYNVNLHNVDGFGNDISSIINKVIVYGGEVEGMQVIGFAEDMESQRMYGVREKVINDSNIISFDQALAVAQAELNFYKEKQSLGTLEVTPGLATVKPGDMIYVFEPTSELNNFFKIVEIKHSFGESFTTKLSIEKFKTDIANVFKERIRTQTKSSAVFNPELFRYSYTFTFSDNENNIETYIGTYASQSVLSISEGFNEGLAISKTKTIPANATHVHIKASGTNAVQAKYEISTNDGVSWETVQLEKTHTLSIPGNNIKVRFTLYPGVSIESVGVYLK